MDIIQLARISVVQVINANTEVQAITGRDEANIVAFNPDAEVELPVIAYTFVVARQLASDGDTRAMLWQFSASAETESQVHELLGAVERALTQSAFYALSTPLDAFVETSIRRALDLDVTLRVSRPTLVPA